MTLHAWAGYVIGGALLVRIVWGFPGTQHARFSDFVTSPGTALRYAKDAVMLRAKRYIGHKRKLSHQETKFKTHLPR